MSGYGDVPPVWWYAPKLKERTTALHNERHQVGCTETLWRCRWLYAQI